MSARRRAHAKGYLGHVPSRATGLRVPAKAHGASGEGAGARSLEDELQLDFFASEGFKRKICAACRAPFWTLDPDRDRCGDNPCVEYSFIGSPLTARRFSLKEAREDFLTFFESRGHTRVAPFPVIARWRTDIYLTTASIADFQPHVTSGTVAPPANPLTISQPCVRLTDLDSVGRSGRHLTAFEMMAHHAFNRDGEPEVYWKERTVELCDEYLGRYGLARESVTYKENPWFGGGNAGPALEVLAGGIELATLVFMFLEEDPEGPVPLGGSKYRAMPTRIVDTGYGLERFLWASNGAPNIYQALYPDVVEGLLDRAQLGIDLEDGHTVEVLARHARFAGAMSVDTRAKLRDLRAKVAGALVAAGVETSVEELEGLMGPLESVFAIAEHTRTIPLLLADGIVPSNVKAGYLARLLIRKTARHLEEIGLEAQAELPALCLGQFERMRRERPVPERAAYIAEVLALEMERAEQSAEKGKRMVRQHLARGGQRSVPLDTLIEFYNSHGIQPSVVREAAAAQGVEVDVPDAFLTIVAERFAGERAEKKRPRKFGVPPTRQLYYGRQGPLSPEAFAASVLWSRDNEVVLDETEFFAESGGQPADHGTLEAGGRSWRVVDVKKEGDAVVHTVEGGPLPAGADAVGRVDRVRRLGHAVHHTATHITLAAAIQVLGPHVWQTGTQKAEREARIDVTHFRRLTRADVDAIERRANEIVLADLPVEALMLPRDEAERLYGIRIFQGGVPDGRVIRVVTIKDTDAECCGGTHLLRTGQVGSIRIKRAERVADGVERLVYCGGLAAVEEGQRARHLLEDSAAPYSVGLDDLPRTAQRFFAEWKERGKEVERLRAEMAASRVMGAEAGSYGYQGPDAPMVFRGKPIDERIGDTRLFCQRVEGPREEVLADSKQLAKQARTLGIFVSPMGDKGAYMVVTRTRDLHVDCVAVLRESMKAAGGGKGGGRPDFAQGQSEPHVDPQQLLERAAALGRAALRAPT